MPNPGLDNLTPEPRYGSLISSSDVALQADIAALEAADTALLAADVALQADIAALQAADVSLDGRLDAVETGLFGTLGLVAIKRLALGLNLSTSSTTLVEMSTSYRITHAQAAAGNFLILIACMTITLGSSEAAAFTFFRDGSSVGIGYGNFAGVGSDNRVVAATFSAGNTSSHTWSPGWAAGGAYQIDHSGGGVANGTFILAEVETI